MTAAAAAAAAPAAAPAPAAAAPAACCCCLLLLLLLLLLLQFVDSVTWDRRLGMLHDVAAGMMYLHKRRYVHGDLRSPNLFVGSNGQVCCDIFLAILLLLLGMVQKLYYGSYCGLQKPGEWLVIAQFRASSRVLYLSWHDVPAQAPLRARRPAQPKPLRWLKRPGMLRQLSSCAAAAS
jgi:serine/threonine protein kinase